ncbi:RNA-binding domain-containing protein [Melanogaster broomeanus]|nr:RNA-binding domain-containing protein [Melanogaster broomeanus]
MSSPPFPESPPEQYRNSVSPEPSAAQAGSTLTNDDIEAVIKLATSAQSSGDRPLRDTRTQLFVGNLPYRVRWQDLKDLFRRAGTVLRADVSLGPDNRSRGYGTVLLATAEDAGRAIDMLNGYCWQTRVLEVRPDRLGASLDSDMNNNHSMLSTAAPFLQAGFTVGAMNGVLPFHIQWQDLKDLFRAAGAVARADVALGPDGRSRGFRHERGRRMFDG